MDPEHGIHREHVTHPERAANPAGRREERPEAAPGATGTAGSLAPGPPAGNAGQEAVAAGPPGWVTLGRGAAAGMIVHRHPWDPIGHPFRLPPTISEPAGAWRSDDAQGRLAVSSRRVATTPTAKLPLVARLLSRMPGVRTQAQATAAAASSIGPAGARTVGGGRLPTAGSGGFGERHAVAPPLPRLEAPTPLARLPRAPGALGTATSAAAPPPSVGRQAAGSEPATTTPGSQPAARIEPEPAVDLARLADQVYELLVRRLASERERRGM